MSRMAVAKATQALVRIWLLVWQHMCSAIYPAAMAVFNRQILGCMNFQQCQTSNSVINATMHKYLARTTQIHVMSPGLESLNEHAQNLHPAAACRAIPTPAGTADSAAPLFDRGRCSSTLAAGPVLACNACEAPEKASEAAAMVTAVNSIPAIESSAQLTACKSSSVSSQAQTCSSCKQLPLQETAVPTAVVSPGHRTPRLLQAISSSLVSLKSLASKAISRPGAELGNTTKMSLHKEQGYSSPGAGQSG